MKNDEKVTAFEYKYNVMAIESEIFKGMYYLYDEDKKGIGILTFPENSSTYVLLNKKQAMALSQELKSIIDEVFRGVL